MLSLYRSPFVRVRVCVSVCLFWFCFFRCFPQLHSIHVQHCAASNIIQQKNWKGEYTCKRNWLVNNFNVNCRKKGTSKLMKARIYYFYFLKIRWLLHCTLCIHRSVSVVSKIQNANKAKKETPREQRKWEKKMRKKCEISIQILLLLQRVSTKAAIATSFQLNNTWLAVGAVRFL